MKRDTLVRFVVYAAFMLAALIFVAACSQGSGLLDGAGTAPSTIAMIETTGAVFKAQTDRRLPDFVPVPGVSCSSALPLILVSSGGERPLTHLDIEWQQNPTAHQVNIHIDKRNEADGWSHFALIREDIRKGRVERFAPAGHYR